MSTRAQRGRASQRAKAKRQSLMPFYVLLAVIAVVGIALIGIQLLPQSAATVSLNPADLSSYPSKGQANAPVTVVEYADFQCPGCAYFSTALEPQFEKDYVETGKVRLIYHDFPLRQHPNAVPAAEAARCAGDQGKYWQMHDILFANQAQWENRIPAGPQFNVYAQQIGLDTAKFQQCTDSGKYTKTIQAAGADAEQAQIMQTPTFVIDGKQYTADKLDQAVKDALAAKGVK